MILKFVLYCFIVAIFLLFLLFIFNMGTISTYGKRISQDIRTYDDFRYYTWLKLNSYKLKTLYEEELCEDMQLTYEAFVLAIYTNSYQIIYERTLWDNILWKYIFIEDIHWKIINIKEKLNYLKVLYLFFLLNRKYIRNLYL